MLCVHLTWGWNRHSPRLGVTGVISGIPQFLEYARLISVSYKQIDFRPPSPKQHPERGFQPACLKFLYTVVLGPPLSRPQRRDQPSNHPFTSLFLDFLTILASLGPRHNAPRTLLLGNFLQLNLQHQHPVLVAKRLPSPFSPTHPSPNKFPERAGNGPRKYV